MHCASAAQIMQQSPQHKVPFLTSKNNFSNKVADKII